jgi:putative transposase
VSAFIEMHRERFGVEPICQTLGVSASAYHHRTTGERSARAVEDDRLTARIGKIHRENYECYGYRRMHAALVREGKSAGRDQGRAADALSRHPGREAAREAMEDHHARSRGAEAP